MSNKLMNTFLIPFFLLYQSYIPYVYVGVTFTKTSDIPSSSTRLNNTGYHYKGKHHYSSDVPTVTVGGDGITIIQENQQSSNNFFGKERDKKAKRKEFKELDLQITKLEEESKLSGGEDNEFTLFGYQLNLLTGLLLVGIKEEHI